MANRLLGDWHEEHEDIVFELGLIRENCATFAIAEAAQKNFEYLIRWGNLEEFQCKCACALARIGSSDSKVALELMAQQSNPGLSKYMGATLKRWDGSDRAGRGLERRAGLNELKFVRVWSGSMTAGSDGVKLALCVGGRIFCRDIVCPLISLPDLRVAQCAWNQWLDGREITQVMIRPPKLLLFFSPIPRVYV